LRGCFVTGTGTGVGKTVVAAAIVATLRARGERVVARKPVLTGLDEPPGADWPRDHELLASVAGAQPGAVARLTFGPPVSPHLAAELAGHPIDPAELVAAIREGVRDDEALVVEGVGGLLVPFADDYDVRDLARELGLPVVVAAHPGLGTINHTLLTLEAARCGALDARAVVLTPWPDEPGMIERSNRDTVARLGDVRVETLSRIPRADPQLLAAAGAELRLDQWLT
jgi:dethiobiotin synthetase